MYELNAICFLHVFKVWRKKKQSNIFSVNFGSSKELGKFSYFLQYDFWDTLYYLIKSLW